MKYKRGIIKLTILILLILLVVSIIVILINKKNNVNNKDYFTNNLSSSGLLVENEDNTVNKNTQNSNETNKYSVSETKGIDKLRLTYSGGISEPEDGIKWSYEIDMNKRESTKYCSSTGLLRDEKLIEKYGYNEKKTRKLSEEEFDAVLQIINETDKYVDKESTAIKKGYFLYTEDTNLYISVDDLNAGMLESITNGY